MLKRAYRNKTTQRGVAVIEFALVFTIVWAVFWSLVCYVAPLIVLQTMHRASAEGARVGAMIPLDDGDGTQRKVQAEAAVAQEMERLPTSWRQGYTSSVTLCSVAPCNFEVIVSQPYAANAPLKPIINLPGIGTIPALPATLSSAAKLRLN